MDIKTVGIVGYGHFGALVHALVQRFAPTVRVLVYRRDKKTDGKTFFALDEVAQSDAVVLAVPINAFEGVLQQVVPLMGERTVVIDVCTVKVHTAQALKRLAKGKRYLATHPVWGPESYEKRGGDIKGFRIVVTDGTLDTEEYKALTEFLKKCGFDVVEMSADAHDKHLAETLFLTHFIGQLVSRAGFERTEVDTVSFDYLMDAVESVKHDEALFRDVFKYNLYCEDVLDRIEKATKEVRGLLEKN